MSEFDIAEARKSMSEAEFRQEYEADFNTYEGQIWNFNHEKCIANNEALDTTNMDVFAGLDVGYRDPTAFCVIGYDWDEEQYYVLDEYLDAEKTTEQHAGEIQILMRNGISILFILIPQHSKLDMTSLCNTIFQQVTLRNLYWMASPM